MPDTAYLVPNIYNLTSVHSREYLTQDSPIAKLGATYGPSIWVQPQFFFINSQLPHVKHVGLTR